MQAFVTGGTGFVGSHLVEELLRRGFAEVRCLVRSEPKWLSEVERRPAVRFVRGDLFSPEALREGVAGADHVYHVAGLTRAETQEALDRANVEGTLNLLGAVEAAAPDVRKVLVTSSLAAVGPSDGKALTEDAPLRPLSRYGRSKAKMEEAVRERFANFPFVIARPSAVYGPREADIFTMIEAADRRRVFPIVGQGRRPQLSLVHVRDVVRGMADAASAEGTAGRTYFLGSEIYYAWEQVRNAVLEALGHGALKVNVPRTLVTPVGAVVEGVGRLVGAYPPLNREKAREAKHEWLCSVERAKRDFDYRQTVGLREGMAETVRWYRERGWL
ncbi:MAG: NAD-dependent epimerase/dehydratase family protein [Rhodothermales bacterium]|nr:NAD-dependent epimerase/dehydratase family protein [Rhodothermales bacterium]